ncbi:MAG TPA: hypothetical protein VFF39_05015 [Verrucomicrobiae bacterium]|nr:hypothetical protein [Verrucomicrobiae bacterium]
MTKQDILAAIVKCAEKLERSPTQKELARTIDVSRWTVRRLFGTYARALRECKLEPKGSGRRVEMKTLFRDWALVARELKRIPSSCEYAYFGKYSEGPLRARFGAWAQVAPGLKRYIEEQGTEEEWKDVLAMINGLDPEMAGKRGRAYARTDKAEALSGAVKEAKPIAGRPVYGAPMRPFPLAHCPINEAGVIFLFGVKAEELGFIVMRLQAEFPDCEAMRRVEGGRCQPVRIEFEFESRNFLKHMHEASGCDLIVCWEHNWPECPLEVLELRTLVS